jgi:hypothetical protein
LKNGCAAMKWIFIFSVVIFCGACEKDAGEGGTSTIRGKVYVKNYNGSGQLVGEYYGQEEHVYIIYGEATYFGDDVKTSYDGTYEFDFLRKGSYTIFAYSKCDTCAAGQEPVIVTTEISKNHSTVELPDLVIKN